MARHVIMDVSGHTTIEFDAFKRHERDSAERRFNELLRRGYVPAYKQSEGRHYVPPQSDRGFQAEFEETIFIPALKGG
jgi:hypothetical protein